MVYQKNKGKCVKAVLETGLSYCAEWILNCAQEMGQTNCWSTMVLASSTKSLPQSWSVMLRLGPPKNKEKSVKVVLEQDCLTLLKGSWTVYKRWVFKSKPIMSLLDWRIYANEKLIPFEIHWPETFGRLILMLEAVGS